MTNRSISPPYRRASGSALIETLGRSLSRIKDEDGHTDKEIGSFLGKGVDAAKAYRTGFAEMPVTAFLRGCETWNGRFGNEVLALIGMKMLPASQGSMTDREAMQALTGLCARLAESFDEVGNIPDRARARLAADLERASVAVDQLRNRMKMHLVEHEDAA